MAKGGYRKLWKFSYSPIRNLQTGKRRQQATIAKGLQQKGLGKEAAEMKLRVLKADSYEDAFRYHGRILHIRLKNTKQAAYCIC